MTKHILHYFSATSQHSTHPAIVLSMLIWFFIYLTRIANSRWLRAVLPMFMLSFIFVVVCELCEGKRIYSWCVMFAYICMVVGYPLIKWEEDWDHINRFTTTTLVLVPSQDMYFHLHISWSVLCAKIRLVWTLKHFTPFLWPETIMRIIFP